MEGVSIDAFLLVSFGGPQGPDDVLPFLRNVTRGRGVTEERLAIVGQQYAHFGGISPINGHNKQLLAELTTSFAKAGIEIPLYWGNRNWHPYLDDTLEQMAADGVQNVVAFSTSAYSSYSSCRQYQEDLSRAVGTRAITVHKIGPFYQQRGFIDSLVDSASAAIARFGAEGTISHVAFCAHSIPEPMAQSCNYVAQLQFVADACQQALEAIHGQLNCKVVFQSASSTPHMKWLTPDVNDHIRQVAPDSTGMLLVPIGFTSDHMEVLFDLDIAAKATAESVGLKLTRSHTPGTDPRYVQMITNMVANYEQFTQPCAATCCPSLISQAR